MKVIAVLCRKFDHDYLEFRIGCLGEIQEAATTQASPENFNYLKVHSFFCLLVVAASRNAAQVLNI